MLDVFGLRWNSLDAPPGMLAPTAHATTVA
jgi:hypothetical protein